MTEIKGRRPKPGPFWPLLPRHGVRLFAPNGGGERFAGLFAQTWRRLPCYARRRILRHWRTGPAVDIYREPRIELLPDWSGRGQWPGLKGPKAAAGGLGHSLVFRTAMVDAYPDELVRDLIAHELAHVFQWACGWDIDREDALDCEAEADDLAEEWGFSSTAMDEWDLAHGVSEVIELDGTGEAAMKRWLGLVMKSGR